MNQGDSNEASAAVESTSHEKHQNLGPHLSNASYYSPNGSVASWSTQVENNSLRENGVLSNSGSNHDQRLEPTLRNVQDGTNLASNNTTSSSGTTNGPLGYSGYAAYPNTDPYGYSNTGYATHYNQYPQQSYEYQQQPNEQQPPSNQYQQPSSQYQQPSSQYQQPSSQYQQPSSQYQPPPSNQFQPPPSNQYQPPPSNQYQQPSDQYQQPANQYQQPSNQYQQSSNQYPQPPNQLGAYQNTGAPYQPISSFPNTGSYAGPASYSSTYYNPGDYQTSGSYTSGTYGTQANLWQGGQYAAYGSHQYPNYASDSNSAYSSTTAAAASQYQQHYKQWEDYYYRTQTEVSCAPGTESTSAPSASSVSSAVPGGTSEYAASNNQMPTAYTTSWRPASGSSELSSMQPATVSSSLPEGYWKHGSTVSQADPPTTVQPHIQNPPDLNPTYGSSQIQPSPSFTQGSMASYSTPYQVPQHQPSFQPFPQPPEHLDSRRGGKLQIPTNPRIASNLLMGVQRTDKDSSMTSTAVKPAYVGVSMLPNVKVASQDEDDSMLKPGTFPKSLRGYVERALARCKDDRQKAASQGIMKEVITRATADGTLHTRDWDTEPLFPIPNMDAAKNDDLAFPIPNSALANNRRSPTRRAKSRWEPVPDEKAKYANIPNGTAKYGVWNKQFSGGKPNNKSLQANSPLSDQKSITKNVGRPAKRQRIGNDLTAEDGDEGSSDSDKGHSLTKYYAAAVALADSPEEKKRREDRSKRFDKGRGNRAGNNNIKAKDVRAGSSYTRRAGALVASRTFEESGSRAVEDIDWDALRVKGTCQEIEKRYLRLTSAPDPATVRPEEVLEKALLMVQSSQKNYLYKCDQLKSIRQDLTVQHIRNELTVKVYETHARLAIESGDMPEYNQCQSQLKSLYAEGIRGCHMEFAAYNLLRVILHPSNNRDLLSAMSRLSAESKRDKAVIHALSVRTAVTSGNYVMFFRLYKTAPNLSTFLMDLYVEKMRYAAIKCISRSYRPTVPVSYLSQILGFGEALPTSETIDEKETEGVEECIEWLKAHGACFTTENSGEMLLDTKASVSSLFMPEAEDAVPHGDANLAVNDFFTRNLVLAT